MLNHLSIILPENRALQKFIAYQHFLDDHCLNMSSPRLEAQHHVIVSAYMSHYVPTYLP